ncbi:hypothetical protein, partial [Acidisphaera rubrifaciens]|uniref:hypothetical protein n=1 Tax=Acidisphaera rubrifaciens TaxID=50715 RepID=UPI0011DDC838
MTSLKAARTARAHRWRIASRTGGTTMTGGEQAYLALVLAAFGGFALLIASTQIREGRARRAKLAATSAAAAAAMPEAAQAPMPAELR